MKKFHISSILSIITGRILTNIDEEYNILNYLTDDNALPYELQRFSDECKPYLLKKFPELKHVNTIENLEELDKGLNNNSSPWGFIELWIDNMVIKYNLQFMYTLSPMPSGMHKYRCPLDELKRMR